MRVNKNYWLAASGTLAVASAIMIDCSAAPCAAVAH
jgi:hypothetical protein